jgi:hypothetical protein
MSDTYTNFPALKYDERAIARQGWGVANSGPTDDQLMVGFYKRSVLNRAKSREQGTPVYESRDYVKIQHPGESLNVVDREVTPQDVQRWPHRWEQFQKNISQDPEGVPLNLLFPASPEIEMTLRGYNIHTVQQLARLSGQAISTVGMGCQEWVNRAAAYMVQAEKGVDHHKFNAAIAEKDKEIATLKRQMADLTRMVQQKLSQPTPVPEGFDYQTAQINQVHASAQEDTAYLQAPAQFVQDLSGSLEPPKRRGRPPGSTNKPKES